MIAPSIIESKGGVATVIKSLLNSTAITEKVKYEIVISHKDGSIALKLFWFAKSLIRVLAKKDFDVAHIHTSCYGSFYRKGILIFILKKKQKPVILHIHGADFDIFYNQSSRVGQRFIKKVLFSSNKILVLSDYWNRYFQETFPGTNVEILSNGVNTSDFVSALKEENRSFLNFLFFGRLEKRKGIFDLLKAINILVNEQGQHDITFYLAGDGDLQKVREIIAGFKLQKNAVVLGWLDDEKKKEILAVIDTVILPSYNEGLPMALLEAMACGKIIISTRVGGIPDLITNEENGFLINPGEPAEIVEKINLVKSRPQEMLKISENNILKINQRYELSSINLKVLDIYAEVINALQN